jgi:glycosyltransferase involved in cell wall biosynthesis
MVFLRGTVNPVYSWFRAAIALHRAPSPPILRSVKGCAPKDIIRSQAGSLSVVVPCFDEEQVVLLFYESLSAVLASVPDLDCDVVFVDDGSMDGTLKILQDIEKRDARVTVYSLSRNFGHQAALTAGLDVARGDAVICMDADLQHPPELIPRMVALWREGNDVVCAVRQSTGDASFLKMFLSRSFYWLINRMSDTHIVSGAADFYLLSKAARGALKSMPERHRFLRGMVSWIGFKRALLPFQAPARPRGKTKYTTVKMLRLALDAVFSFSPQPIRMISRLGVIIVLMGALYLLYVAGRFLWAGDLVPGWASLIGVVSILGGCQLLAIGVIGEYLARLFEEAKKRPLYLFKRVPPPRGEKVPCQENLSP